MTAAATPERLRGNTPLQRRIERNFNGVFLVTREHFGFEPFLLHIYPNPDKQKQRKRSRIKVEWSPENSDGKKQRDYTAREMLAPPRLLFSQAPPQIRRRKRQRREMQ